RHGTKRLAKTRRSISGGIEALGRRVACKAEQDLGSEASGGWRRLDAEAPLTGEPEEARLRRIEAVNRKPVRGEAAQARPLVLDRKNPPVDHLFEAVDGNRDVEFLGCGVARRARGFVVRAQPQLPMLRPEVELPLQV